MHDKADICLMRVTYSVVRIARMICIERELDILSEIDVVLDSVVEGEVF